MFLSILNRTIFFELLKIFALSLLGITGMMVMAGIVAEATQQGLGPMQILVIIPLLVPSFLPYTIPATTLFATCVVYGRLAHDNEILAIRAAGVNILKVVTPCALMGVLMSATTMGLYYSLIPTTHHLLRSRFLNDMEEYLYALLKKDHCIKQPSLGYYVWVRQVQGTDLIDALFKHQEKNGHYDISAQARKADLMVDQANRKLLIRMKHCDINEGGIHLYVESRIWEVPLPEEMFSNRKVRARAMTWPELIQRRREMADEQSELDFEIEQAKKGIYKTPDGTGYEVRTIPTPEIHVTNLVSKRKQKRIEMQSLVVETQMRPALALGCLCFVLIGCPVGVWFSRSDYLSAFMTCFLPIVFLYYPLLLCGTNLAKQEKVPAAIAIWAANTVMAVIALGLFRKLLRN